MSDGGYPAGAQYDPAAPWNEPESKRIKVTVYVSYQKETEIEVNPDYTLSDVLESARNTLRDPATLLNDVANSLYIPLLKEEAKGWEMTEFEIETTE